jgi:Peptidase family S41
MKIIPVAIAMSVLTAAPVSAEPVSSVNTASKRLVIEQNLRDFDFVVEKVAANYAGYDVKTQGTRHTELSQLTAKLRARAAKAPAGELAAILSEWVGFFHDEHTQITALTGSGGDEGKTPTAASVARVSLTEAEAIKRLLQLEDRRDPMEGIWTIDKDRYRLAVIRNDLQARSFAAIVLASTADSWSPGMVKSTIRKANADRYTADYRTGDFSRVELTGALKAGNALFDVGDYGTWQRQWPPVADPDGIDRAFPSPEFFLRRLSPSTLWIRIPNFHDDEATTIAKLVADHAADLEATPNLLIDMRRNGGGSDFAYQPLLPYLYTRPIYSIGMEMRASRDNIALRQEIADRLKDSPEAADAVKELKAQNALMAKHLGQYVNTDARPFSVSKFDKILPFPKRIAVLIDNAGSTGEQFLLDARQSHKVTLFGQQNSAGVLDFANVVSAKSPSGRFEIQWATSRSLRLPDDPVDNGGIAPDIPIPSSESDPVTYVQKWLERQVD